MNQRLKELRKILKLSQEELGSKLGVTKSAISRMEIGTYKITDSMVKLICQEFNVSENWFRTGEGEMFINDEGKDLFYTLGEKYKTMDDMDKKIISEYLKLDPAEREILKKYIKRLTE